MIDNNSNNYIKYESKGDRNKSILVKEYFIKIRPYLRDIISNLKKADMSKIQLTITFNFISSKNNDEERVMHSTSDNIEITINDEPDEIIKELFKSLIDGYKYFRWIKII